MAALADAVVAPVLAGVGRWWVASERERHRPAAAPLSEAARATLEPFYEGWILDVVRVRVVERLDPPPLVATVRRLGVPLPLEIGRIAGIAFVDTVVLLDFVGESRRTPLLFHELVHVVQYHLLGLSGFVDRYVGEWMGSGRSYRAIPMEVEAYALTERFAAAPDEPFDVVAEVERGLAARSGPA